MEKETVTIYDVAREAGVSMATVSRVVNGNQNVKESTRKKVEEVIQRLNYRPNAVARGLASRKTTTIGVIIPDVTNLYFSSIARGVDDVASMYKYNIFMANSDGEEKKEIRVLQTLLAQQVDGVIYMGNTIGDYLRKEIRLSRVPIVLAGTVDSKSEFPAVHINYEDATRDAVRKLVETHNEKIALIIADKKYPIDETLRMNGYLKGLQEAGIEVNEDYIIRTLYSYEQGEVVYKRLKEMGVTAAVVSNDLLAVSIVGAALDHNEKIPEDFEVITSDNSMLTEAVRPQLTTIKQPLYDIGAVAMRMLTKLMAGEMDEDTLMRQFELPYVIDERRTTK
ncbi:catabolite control protein A [Allofustis seminis]|uniref:catabolite control protein A n=1 Tax=Allofustis seminis TaxID=166939 RepID=UPI00037E7B00|nr:catabolite control protein A [Allofustis seminis]